MARNVSARPRTAPHGAWRSPVTADAIVAGVIGLSQVQLDGDDLYWVEQRPAEEGRNVIVRVQMASLSGGGQGGGPSDVTPPDFNARTRVHEYGGGAYVVNKGTVWFTNYGDQRLYVQEPNKTPVPITPPKDIRHADLVMDDKRGRLIAVREDHSTGSRWAVNTIVSLARQGGEDAKTLAEGNDFYASPRVNPAGTHLCWLTWNHPNMPWDGTELWVGELTDDGAVRAPRKVAGAIQESICQPSWSADGVLYFVSDRTNWWNLYRWNGLEVEPVVEMPAELGTPQWLFGMSTYAFESDHRIVCQVRSQGVGRLATIDLDSKRLPPLIVYVHGGPTGSVSNALDLSDQFWTTRGFGYLVVNYGGSSGYGREYRQRLNGQWGVVDVNDAVQGARYLIDRGLVDGNRVAITGGSAGGYTVLRAMTSGDFFKAGASHFGISDLETFHNDTHKFESMYDQGLIGRWPEDRNIYRARSAIHSVDRIRAPIILLQGLEDKIVPPSQAEVIVEAMRKKGLPVAYIAFEGEQHGFRMAKNIKRALEAELYFYSKIFGFQLAELIEPVQIGNL